MPIGSSMEVGTGTMGSDRVCARIFEGRSTGTMWRRPALRGPVCAVYCLQRSVQKGQIESSVSSSHEADRFRHVRTLMA